MVAKLDLMGRVFGRLTVLAPAPSVGGRGRWLCRCVCGMEKSFPASRLTRGQSKSCGCLVVDTSRARALRDAIGGYKGYAKYTGLSSYLSNTTKVGECLEWAGAVYRNGYARFPKNSRIVSEIGHRAVFMLEHGYLPPVVMHTCDNRRCINPAHLRAGTYALNNADRVHKKRDLHLRRLTEAQVLEIRAAHAAGQSAYSLGKQFGVAKQTILSIIHRKTWSHL